MTNGVLTRARKPLLVGLAALAATALVLLVLNRTAGRREGQAESTEELPESVQRLPDWVKAWQEATPEERVELVERIDRKEPLTGLTVDETICLLGQPKVASWRCGTAAGLLYPLFPLKEVVFLVVTFDEEGFVKEAELAFFD